MKREFSITEITEMFDLSRDTVRKRLAASGVKPLRLDGSKKIFDMAIVGPALFATPIAAVTFNGRGWKR